MADIGSDDINSRSLGAAIFYVLLGPIIWALNFTIMYGAHAALCSPGVLDEARREAVIARWVVFSATLASTLLVSIAVLILARRQRTLRTAANASPPPDDLPDARRIQRLASYEPFLNSLADLLAIISLIGLIWWGVAQFFLDPCLQMR